MTTFPFTFPRRRANALSPALPGVAALVLAAAFAARAAAAAEDIRADYRKECETVRANLHRMETSWYRWLLRLQREGKAPLELPRQLRITLTGGLYDKDLHVEALEVGGEWVFGRAWAPSWNHALHGVTNAVLKSSKDEEGELRLQGTLHLRLESDGILPVGGKPIECAYTVNLKRNGDNVRGTYLVVKPEDGPPTIPLKTGACAGAFVPLSAPPQPAPDMPRLQIEKLSVYERYAVVREAVAESSRLYRDMRAFEVSRQESLPLDDARKNVLLYVPQFPELKSPKQKEVERRRTNITVDDAMNDAMGGLDEILGTERQTRKQTLKEDTPEVRAALNNLRAMRAYTDTLLAWVANRDRVADQPVPAFMRDTLTTEDPDFGPWYDMEALPYDQKVNRHSIPADVDAEGLQLWPCVSAWKVTAPLPLTDNRYHLHGLPEIVPATDVPYRFERNRLKRGSALRFPGDITSWITLKRSRPFGYLCPPNWGRHNRVYEGCSRSITTDGHSGLEFSTFYAYTEIAAPRDMELWTALGLQQEGKLWINDQLAWTGPTKINVRASEYMALTRLRFTAGVNRLLLRVDAGQVSPHFWMRLCLRGQPRDAAAVKAHDETVARAREQIKPLETCGYRGDFTGNFPDATPPAAWDYRTGDNVLWQTRLPYWANASPILAGDRVIVTMEPFWLICLNKSDGAIRWQRRVTALDLLENPAAREEGNRLMDAYWQARLERDRIPPRLADAERWISRTQWFWKEPGANDAEQDERKDASPALLALLDKRDELEASEDPQAVREELSDVLKKINAMKEKAAAASPEGAEAKRKIKHLRQCWNDLMDFVSGQHLTTPGMNGYWTDYDGYAFSTPITDGTHIWWKNGFQVLACYDLDGNVKWMADTAAGASQSAAASSTLLIDGKIIIKTPNAYRGSGSPYNDRFGTEHGDGPVRLAAYDAATGAALWEALDLPSYGYNWNANTPAPVTLTNGREFLKVLVTAGGAIVRIDDGKVLVPQLGANSEDASVIPVGDIVLFPRSHMTAFKLTMIDRDTVGARRLWSNQMGSHGIGYHGCIVDRERRWIYHETAFGHFKYSWPSDHSSAAEEKSVSCIVVDLLTGKEKYALDMFRQGGNYWSLSTVTRRHVFMCGGDSIFSQRVPPSNICVVRRGENPVVLARNIIERTYGGPVFEGDRMYIRGYRGVTCVGYTGEAGRRFETRAMAEAILDEIHSEPPPAGDPVELPAPRAKRIAAHRPASRVEDGRGPAMYLIGGPFDLDKADTVLRSLDGAIGKLSGETTLSDGSARQTFSELSAKSFPRAFVVSRHAASSFMLTGKHRRILALGDAVGNKAPAVYYLSAELRVTADGIMRYEQTLPNVRTWFGGREIRHGDRLDLRKGYYSYLAEIRVPSIPEGGLFFSPMFRLSTQVKEERERWFTFARRNREYLDRVIETAPDSPEAARARKVLQAL